MNFINVKHSCATTAYSFSCWQTTHFTPYYILCNNYHQKDPIQFTWFSPKVIFIFFLEKVSMTLFLIMISTQTRHKNSKCWISSIIYSFIYNTNILFYNTKLDIKWFPIDSHHQQWLTSVIWSTSQSDPVFKSLYSRQLDMWRPSYTAMVGPHCISGQVTLEFHI